MSEQNEQNAMLPSQPTSPFESIRHTDENGDYWNARELMPLLEYSSWERFEEAIQRAMTDCAKSGRRIEEHFILHLKVKNKDGASETRGRKAKDYRLTRYACRLITMTSQTSGAVAAQARTYFSDRVDEAEQAELLPDPDLALLEWRRRAVASYMARGYS